MICPSCGRESNNEDNSCCDMCFVMCSIICPATFLYSVGCRGLCSVMHLLAETDND